MESAASYKSLLFQMTQTTPTCLWNDSAALDELAYSIGHGAVGATCNPVIALSILKRQMPLWRGRIEALLGEMPTATEDQIGWKIVEEMSVKGAGLLKPVFDAQGGRTAAFPYRRIRGSTGTSGLSWSKPFGSASLHPT